MAISYSMKITQMDCLPESNGQTNVVSCVHWAYTGTDGDKSAGFGGSTPVEYTGGPFTPVSGLTEEQVCSWVIDSWSPQRKAEIEDAIATQMTVVPATIPWIKPTEFPVLDPLPPRE